MNEVIDDTVALKLLSVSKVKLIMQVNLDELQAG